MQWAIALESTTPAAQYYFGGKTCGLDKLGLLAVDLSSYAIISNLHMIHEYAVDNFAFVSNEAVFTNARPFNWSFIG